MKKNARVPILAWETQSHCNDNDDSKRFNDKSNNENLFDQYDVLAFFYLTGKSTHEALFISLANQPMKCCLSQWQINP